MSAADTDQRTYGWQYRTHQDPESGAEQHMVGFLDHEGSEYGEVGFESRERAEERLVWLNGGENPPKGCYVYEIWRDGSNDKWFVVGQYSDQGFVSHSFHAQHRGAAETVHELNLTQQEKEVNQLRMQQ